MVAIIPILDANAGVSSLVSLSGPAKQFCRVPFDGSLSGQLQSTLVSKQELLAACFGKDVQYGTL